MVQKEFKKVQTWLKVNKITLAKKENLKFSEIKVDGEKNK